MSSEARTEDEDEEMRMRPEARGRTRLGSPESEPSAERQGERASGAPRSSVRLVSRARAWPVRGKGREVEGNGGAGVRAGCGDAGG